MHQLDIGMVGHCKIVDDLGCVHLDASNAIHPQNMSRIIARALSNEHNYFINRIAFGNGGTVIDAAYNTTFRPANDGQSPDVTTWDSRLYNEIFSKIIDDGQDTLNPLVGTDPGSADLNVGVRAGGGAVHASDPLTIPHVSGPGVRSFDLGLTSEVVISAVINADEPNLGGTVSDFTFDEIGLYTPGSPAINTSGYQYIDVGNKISTDNTGLAVHELYSFVISSGGGTPLTIIFTTPAAGGSGVGGEILYGDLCQAINTGDPAWGFTGITPLPDRAFLSITDNTNGDFSTITGAITHGFLKFTSRTAGSNSSILVTETPVPSSSMVHNINSPIGGIILAPVQGTAVGVQNTPTNPSAERERLLTHLTFVPITKPAHRAFNFTYTITISTSRTQ
jgi:hypothetical protein